MSNSESQLVVMIDSEVKKELKKRAIDEEVTVKELVNLIFKKYLNM